MLKFIKLFCVSILLALTILVPFVARAQQTLGSINGTVTDTTGAVVQKASVNIRNTGTNLVVTVESKDDGSFSVADLPIGTYEVTFTKDGFEKAVYPPILVQGNHTTTVNATLQPGEITTSVTVESTPLLNQTDTSNGYTLGTRRDSVRSARNGQLHAARHSRARHQRGFPFRLRQQRRSRATRESWPTASAIPATASRLTR